MNTTRFRIFLVSVSLVLTILLVLQVYRSATSAKPAGSSNIGMGDLRLFEERQSKAPGSELNVHSMVGFGGLRRFEAQASAPNDIGMGDLRRFEAQKASTDAASGSSQTLQRVCPSLSSAYGGRDNGASAPAYVLRAMGCPIPASK